MSLSNRIGEFIEEKDLIDRREPLIIAVSGGIDSMVLLNVMRDLGFKISVVHCNFSLRGESSDLDESLVKSVCQKMSLRFHSKRFETLTFAKNNRIGVQEAARKLRYTYFQELVENFGYEKVATAHHLDDNIETVLINLYRGTGLKGLTGIPLKRESYIRPLLDCSKSEIIDYAKENSIKYREDASNKENKYLRNAIRNLIIPKLKSKEMDFYLNWRSRIDAHQRLWKDLFIRINKVRNICIRENLISIEKLKKFENPEELLFYFLEGFDFSINQRREAGKLLVSQSGRGIYGVSHYLLVDRNFIKILPNEELHEVNEFIQHTNQRILTPWGSMQIYNVEKAPARFDSEGVAYVDQAKLTFPLRLRTWKEGDYFKPLGMRGKKKISDYLIDIKLSRDSKNKQLLLLSGDEVIWVVGRRLSDSFKIDENTVNILKIEWEENHMH